MRCHREANVHALAAKHCQRPSPDGTPIRDSRPWDGTISVSPTKRRKGWRSWIAPKTANAQYI